MGGAVNLVFAGPRALEDADRLGLDGCLENRVEQALGSGPTWRRGPDGRRLRPHERAVLLDASTVARIVRDRAPLTHRGCWRVLAVTRVADPYPTIPKE